MSRQILEDNNYDNDRQPIYHKMKHKSEVKIKKLSKKDVKQKLDDKIEKTELDEDVDVKSE